MKIHMPISGDVIQGRSTRLEIIGLIIDGLFLFQSFGSGNSAVISIWSACFQLNDSRYVSAHEAIWRLFAFPMHEEFPNIYRLHVHTENQQSVVFGETDPLPT